MVNYEIKDHALMHLSGPRIAGLVSGQRLTVGLEVPILVNLLKFDPDRFEVLAFTDLQVAMPRQIAGSVRTRQAEFFFGRVAARLSLLEHGNEGQVGIGFSREPIWPAGYIGSISHCRYYAAACAMPRANMNGIGIDIEQAIGLDAQGEIERIVLLPCERELLNSLGSWPRALLLAAAFSAKESFFKAVSSVAGGYFGFETIAIDQIDVAARRITFTVVETICDEWPEGSKAEIALMPFDDDLILTAFLW